MPERLPALELIGREVRSERTALTAHADALDTKSSVVLGFAGALTTLSAAQEGVLTGAATVVSGLAALIALWAFQPRAYPVVEVGALRDKYATSDPRFAERKLLDTYIQMCDALRVSVRTKALLLSWATRLVAVAAALLVGARIIG